MYESAFVWERLKLIKNFKVWCQRDMVWEGFGEVSIEFLAEDEILFKEKGEWKGRNLSFQNALRWRYLPSGILLERVRLDQEAPPCAILLEPGPVLSGHYDCGRDRYSVELFSDERGVHLHWSISGPKKKERIRVLYLYRAVNTARD